ncbi:hypothetical protein FGO68_gene12723 [Halteria grandinella]|uniref:Uncharacterized protein n=1 Tax=Halteria grandinella TaxID=5974 RepID=A0A8J8NM41_HALGN|nr:hypothetical protein FGO68_gene12723 [Halteria grandinella]
MMMEIKYTPNTLMMQHFKFYQEQFMGFIPHINYLFHTPPSRQQILTLQKNLTTLRISMQIPSIFALLRLEQFAHAFQVIMRMNFCQNGFISSSILFHKLNALISFLQLN